MKNNIKALRKKQKLTQKKLAEKTGISHQSIWKVEKGLTIPNLTIAFKLSKFFKLPIEQIFEDDSDV
ncbi:helix-turn-helix transcriptional regulator [Methanococcus maripaludis]|uniref:Putative transcriptional regulator n=1 Tax=Methanococcus maripaludis TaxID=39152 RepID=A0A7J9PMK7_METMI|nr:helix-turn-helix domain-containing protein [Methanococcus maripaludis]MBA2864445.1 putative transcriptional regulator [Methanococcus maripaludis]